MSDGSGGADQGTPQIELRFPASVYSLEAVKRAAYRFIDRMTVEIGSGATEVVCRITPTRTMADVDALLSEFKNEVLDQDLRLRVGEETAPIRNLILSLAFSKTGLQG